MKELRTYDVLMTPIPDGPWVLKSEADRYIAHLKRKYCEKAAESCENELFTYPSFGTVSQKELRIARHRDKWHSLAEHYKGML